MVAPRLAQRFLHRRVLVTGSAKGIGRAIAAGFAAEGARVAHVDISDDHLRGDTNEIAKRSKRHLYIRGDVTSKESVEEFMGGIIEEFAGLDIVINNVGLSTRGTIETTSIPDWDRMALNTRSIYLVSRCALPALRESKVATIINIGSTVGVRGIPNTAAYGASKAGVIALTKLMALDCGVDGIRVNCVCPGLVETDNLRYYTELYASKSGLTPAEAQQLVLRHYPLKRLGQPQDVAHAVLFLASDEASWISGEILNVDGGRSAGTDEEDL